MDEPTGVKTIDDYKKMEEKFKEYLIKEFGIDKDFDKYPLVEVRVSNFDKKDAMSPGYIYKDDISGMSDMVGNYVDEITFSVHVKIRQTKDKPVL